MSVTKRDRIAAVFHNEKTDKVPVGFWHHFTDNPRGENAFLHPEIADTVLAGQASFVKSFSPDLIKIMTDGFFGYSNPVLNRPLADIREAAQIKPLGKDSDWYRSQIHYAKRYVDIYGQDVPLFYNLFAPVRTLAILQSNAGQDSQKQILHWLQEAPKVLEQVLAVIAEDYSLLAKGLIEEAGVDGIYLSVNSINYDQVTGNQYAETIAPSEIQVLQAAKEVKDNNILHICGFKGFHNHLEWYTEYPALVFNWAVHVEGYSLSKGKELFGGHAVIGGFGQTEQDLLYEGTEKEIKEETRRLLQDAGTTGVILGADCTIPRNTDPRHLQWVREAADSFIK